MKTRYVRDRSDTSSDRESGKGQKGRKGRSSRSENPSSRHNSNKSGQNQKGPFKARRSNSGPSRGSSYRRRTRSFQRVPNELLKRLDNLFDIYLKARKKFFEGFYGLDEEQRIKLKNEFYNSLQNLRKHESFLYRNHRSLWQERSFSYRLDRTYQNNREHSNTEEETDSVNNDEAPSFLNNVHQLPTQINRESYKDDSSESVGDMNVYHKFKTEKTY